MRLDGVLEAVKRGRLVVAENVDVRGGDVDRDGEAALRDRA